jgi:DNA sulfur modification protein DndD
MRFEKIRLQNWGPFQGSHEISLSTTDGAPVVLIFGENGKGKTSFAKALRWCLYGEHSSVTPAQYANWGKIVEGTDFEVGVTVWFSVRSGVNGDQDGEEFYELTRNFTARPDGRTTLRVAARNIDTQLRQTGASFVDQSQIPRFVHKHLPLEMARFFLFDGEELNSLKTELEGGGVSSSVRDGIESVMGIPALKELDGVIRDKQKVIDKCQGRVQGHLEAQQALETAKLNLEQKESTLIDTKRTLKETEDKVEALRADLARHKEVADKLAQKELHIKNKAAAEGEARETQNDIREHLHESWWIPLAAQIKKSQDREMRQRIQSGERIQLLSRLAQLQSILDSGTCSTCGQTAGLGDAQRQEMIEIREKVRTSIDETIEQHGFVERFRDPDVKLDRLRNFLVDERRALNRAREIRDDLAILEMQLVEVDEEWTKGLLPLLLNAQKFAGGLKESVQSLEKEVLELRSVESEKRKALVRLGGIPESQENLSKALQQLQDIIGKVRESFRDKVREEVVRVASSHYVNMMQNEDLIGIDITSDFRVRPINRAFDEPKPLSSYGQSLIAVYAFIGALMDVSGNDGAWLIDTVGSRLDQDKMRAVWEWLSTRNRQVIAMPHSGELTKDDATVFVGSRISRRYEIVDAVSRDADSRIVEVLS